MAPLNTNKMSILLKLLIFHAIYLGTFLSLLFIDLLHNFVPGILVVPLISYIALFFIEAKARINKQLNYDTVWSGCFWFSFWVGATLTLPMIIFRLGPDGPFQ